MQLNSVYCVECLCGHHIESETKTLVCPTCQRLVVIEWPVHEEKDDREVEVKIPAAA